MESKRSLVLEWLEKEGHDEGKLRDALMSVDVLPDTAGWRCFVRDLFFWLGGLALAFSAMFFIAYNWDALGRFAKFGLIEVLMALCVLAYWKFDPDSLTGKIALMMSSILLGVLLAFYGQTYQTGADPWQLFANWALLMLPWLIVARFAAMWVLWVALLNLSISLYFEARGWFGFRFASSEYFYWVSFAINLVVWVAWEGLALRFGWLAQRWAVRLVALACGIPISVLACLVVFEDYPSSTMALLVYGVWLAALFYLFRKRIMDLFMLAAACLSLIIFLTSLFARALIEHGNAMGSYLIMSLLVIGMVAAAAAWLKKIHREQQG